MSELKVIGLDLAKSVFHTVGLDRHEKVVKRKMLKRARVLEWFAQVPPCVVAMEACAGAHHWARRLQALGHTVRLIPPQYVKAFLRGNKNDFNDAQAIAEAANRPTMRFVAVKTVAQQDLQALVRLRAAVVKERTATCNQLRGLLAEHGLVLPRGVAVMRKRLPELLEDAENALTPLFRELLAQGQQRLKELDEHIRFYDRQLDRQARTDEAVRRLDGIPGFGSVLACSFSASVGDGTAYRRSRDVSAAHGLVPKQHSSGGKEVLLGISKRGDSYLRNLLINGARAVLRQAERKDDSLSQWARKLRARRGYNVAVVALANKLARIGWAVARHQSEYRAA